MHPQPAAQLEQARTRYPLCGPAVSIGKDISIFRHREAGQIPFSDIPGSAFQSSLLPLEAAQQSQNARFRFIDLFAGIGGIRKGFEVHGGQCVFTSEWNDFSKKTYLENFGDTHPFAGDITRLHADEIPDHDVLLAGFPCQPFSIAGVSKKNALGKPHGFECTTQGTLFFDVARIIARKRPAAFLLENVKNLLSHDKGNIFRVMNIRRGNETRTAIMDDGRIDAGYQSVLQTAI